MWMVLLWAVTAPLAPPAQELLSRGKKNVQKKHISEVSRCGSAFLPLQKYIGIPS